MKLDNFPQTSLLSVTASADLISDRL